MNRTVRNSLIAVAALVLAYPAIAWLMGLRVQHIWEDREQQGLQQIPGYSEYVTIVKRDYRRGVYSATENVTFRLGEKILQALRNTGNANLSGHIELTVRNTIHHGPFPLGRDFAPATIDTEWLLPAEVHADLVAMFQGKANLTIHTRMNWSGGSTTRVSSPAFNVSLDKNASIDWRGLEANVTSGSDIGSGTVSLTSPGLTYKGGPEGNIAIYRDLKLDSTLHPVYEVLNVGDVKLTLGQLQFEIPNKPSKLSAHNVVLESHSKTNGEFVDAEGGVTVEVMQVNAFDINHINYAARLAHMDAQAAAALIKALRAARSDAPATAASQEAAAASAQKILNVFKGPGVDLLVKEPVLDISHLGFAMPEGALDIALKASMPGVTKEELQGERDVLKMAIIKHLQAIADIRIDTGMLDKLLASTGKGENVANQLQLLERQGYIKLDGKALTTHLTFLGGQFKVNDQPFPPRPPGAAPK